MLKKGELLVMNNGRIQISILGEVNVGKTTMAHIFQNPKIDKTLCFKPTLAADVFYVNNIPIQDSKKNVDVTIFDMAGGTRTFTSPVWSKSYAMIAVFSIDDPATLQSAIDLTQQALKLTNLDSSVVMFVGNKADLTRKIQSKDAKQQLSLVFPVVNYVETHREDNTIHDKVLHRTVKLIYNRHHKQECSDSDCSCDTWPEKSIQLKVHNSKSGCC